MTQSEILCCPSTCFGPVYWWLVIRGQGSAHHSFRCAPLASLKRSIGAHPAYSWRHGQIWDLVLVKVLNLVHTALQWAFIPGLLRKLSVYVVKYSMSVIISAPLCSFGCKSLMWGVVGSFRVNSTNASHATISDFDKNFTECALMY